MPLHFPHRSHTHHEDPAFIPTSPSAKRNSLPPLSTTTTSSSSDSRPTSILIHPTSHRTQTSSSEFTNSSSSGSAYLTKRLGGLSTLDRVDSNRSNRSSIDDDDRDSMLSASTPGTSVSSLNHQCPLPVSSATNKFPFFVLTLSSTSTLSFMALPLYLRPVVIDAVNRAWRKGINKMTQVEYQPELMQRHKDKGCEGGVWEVTLKDTAWMPKSEDKVSSRRILINLMTEFAREGYNLSSSFRTSAKDSGKDTMIFLLGEPDPDPIIFAVAFHSSDRIWIIDAEADVGEALEEGIKNSWIDGIRDARVRERHCREIRLRGNPWTAHSTSNLISARCIHLVIMKSITHCSRGYDFVNSVDMADMEEGEMPVTFYRKKWKKEGNATWGENTTLKP